MRGQHGSADGLRDPGQAGGRVLGRGWVPRFGLRRRALFALRQRLPRHAHPPPINPPDTALDKIQATGERNVENGFRPDTLARRRRPPAWFEEQYRVALRCIARAPHHAVRRSALEWALGETGLAKGSVAVESMLEYNLLALRPFSTQAWARDLPREVYGPSKRREEVVTMPDPSSLRHVLLLEEEWADGEGAAGGGGGSGGGGDAASG